ncbi:uncharacterized protein B0P05DRAFT_433731, partial [Gilbertella persicaria]|uniref:uncharacterized protein n=1 Tax=Gilbertella persicaria TaxID=101096 RepID=UPI002220AD57
TFVVIFLLLVKFELLKQKLHDSPLVNIDPNVVICAPGADFTPSSAMLDGFPYIQKDSFKRPLEDTDR